jgi:hypothetical protein
MTWIGGNKMPAGIQPNNPFTLFLIFILLLLSTNSNTDKGFNFVKTILKGAQNASLNMENAWQTWEMKVRQMASL